MKKNIVMKNRTIECRIGSQLRVFYNYVCTLRKGAAFFYDNTNLGINDTIEEMFLKEQGWYHKNLSDVNKMLKKVNCKAVLIADYYNVCHVGYYSIVCIFNFK